MTTGFASEEPLAVAPGSLFLATGVNGYIGSHIANELLAAGYKVRGTARDARKADWISEFFERKYGKGVFECVIVPDVGAPGAFDDIVKGVAGIVHVATLLTWSPDPSTVIPQAVTTLVNALKAAANEPSVKRFVFTSSSTAVTLPKPNQEFSIDENSWNDEAVEAANAPPPYEPSRGYTVFAASKTEAERAAWNFMRENRPHFVFNTVLPDVCFGELLDPKNQPGSTGNFIRELYFGDGAPMKTVPMIPPQHFVDVRDVALVHLAALTMDKVNNERIFAFAAPFNWNEVFAILRRICPDRKFPEDIPNEGHDLSKVPNGRGVDLLHAFGQSGWTTLEESVKNNIKGL